MLSRCATLCIIAPLLAACGAGEASHVASAEELISGQRLEARGGTFEVQLDPGQVIAFRCEQSAS